MRHLLGFVGYVALSVAAVLVIGTAREDFSSLWSVLGFVAFFFILMLLEWIWDRVKEIRKKEWEEMERSIKQ